MASSASKVGGLPSGGPGRSAEVSTATTPGISVAALVSIPVISACATGLRTIVTYAAPVSSGSRRSSV